MQSTSQPHSHWSISQFSMVVEEQVIVGEKTPLNIEQTPQNSTQSEMAAKLWYKDSTKPQSLNKMRSKAVQICRSYFWKQDWLFLHAVTVLFTDSLSHFTAHPPLLFYFSIPLSLCTLNHRFNKQRLRRKRITPSVWLYKTCFFHICYYNYIASCFYSH